MSQPILSVKTFRKFLGTHCSKPPIVVQKFNFRKKYFFLTEDFEVKMTKNN